jgi:hypothetical protein
MNKNKTTIKSWQQGGRYGVEAIYEQEGEATKRFYIDHVTKTKARTKLCDWLWDIKADSALRVSLHYRL